ncbi:ornithine carbamoyltransferase [Aeromicrobium panaciterrae]|uniref:Ornithine carbamoyltransferase n=1 Tax=Aeromicrobium panaciterrae TaxID=363861 RepID=A0ABU1UJ52_9ACTN|nr:ornithine carbamoyltransferase [Aeromicrobium panaciterrae]MDR7085216.1 ornithine carbamoyltransferase [Aeromicrobium panaciterrae]
MGRTAPAHRGAQAEKKSRHEIRRLVGRNIALVFAKNSTRTRCAFEVAAHDQGAHVTYLDPTGSQLGHKESVKDTGRVLGRMFDGIEYRGFAHASVEDLARSSGVPVWNGLSDTWHPTQSLCDVFTMLEHSGKAADKISFAYVGDARNNVGNSLLVAGAMSGMDVRMVGPQSLWNSESVMASATAIARETEATILQTSDPRRGLEGVDFVYTDVWVSMGEPEKVWTERLELLNDYQVNADLMSLSGRKDTAFMHCLPAFHDRRTEIGEKIFKQTGRVSLEVTDEVFESDSSIVFDQAENRMHSIKAMLVATLED